MFISRLLNILRDTPKMGNYQIPGRLKHDVQWWVTYLPQYNGVSVAWMRQNPVSDQVVSADASSVWGIGGYLVSKQYFHRKMPPQWRTANIAYLEMWGVILALRVWGPLLQGCRVVMECDNMAVVEVLTHGRSRDLFLQGGM